MVTQKAMASGHADRISGCGQGAPNFQVQFLANGNLLRIPLPEVSGRSVHMLSVLCQGCGEGVLFPPGPALHPKAGGGFVLCCVDLVTQPLSQQTPTTSQVWGHENKRDSPAPLPSPPLQSPVGKKCSNPGGLPTAPSHFGGGHRSGTRRNARLPEPWPRGWLWALLLSILGAPPPGCSRRKRRGRAAFPNPAPGADTGHMDRASVSLVLELQAQSSGPQA